MGVKEADIKRFRTLKFIFYHERQYIKMDVNVTAK